LMEQTEILFETPDIDVVRLKSDLGNMCGCCVVAGNVRRSAELNKGSVHDSIFLNLKDYSINPDREEWGWMSNNSVALKNSEDFEMLGEVARRVVTRGEPGVMNLKNFKYGRLGKGHLPAMREDLADGLNPCGEIPLEDKELCNVVETVPTRCPNVETWYKACEYAAFYAATVSLLPTHREETNRVVVRNRLPTLASRNLRNVLNALSSLSAGLGFRVAHGISERVIFRELFPFGLTAFDPLDRGILGVEPTMSHVAARREIRELIDCLRLPMPGSRVSRSMPPPLPSARRCSGATPTRRGCGRSWGQHGCGSGGSAMRTTATSGSGAGRSASRPG